MRLSLVSITVAFAAVACSDATSPVAATRRGIHLQTVGDTLPPIAEGVHVDTLPLPFPEWQIRGINNLGQLSGTVEPDTGGNAAFRGTPGHFQFLANNFAAGAFNDEGDLLVASPGPAGSIWEASGKFVNLALPFDSASECGANNLNDLRQSAGVCPVFPASGGPPDFYPTQWRADGTAELLSASGVQFEGGQALSINQLGQIAGFTGLRQAFVYSQNHHVRLLPNLPGTTGQSAVAWHVNELGWVAGQIDEPSGPCPIYRAVAWTPSDSVVDLGVCGQALWISTYGNVVLGQSAQNNQFDDFAFVWTPTTGLRQLPHVQNAAGSLEFDQPTRINELGQILGTANINLDFPNGASTTINVIWTLPPGYGR